MDYSNYTISELKDSLDNIDKDAYPNNYKKLIEELHLRKDEVEDFDKEKAREHILTTERRLTVLSWLQIITAIAFVYVGVTNFDAEQKIWVNLLPFGVTAFNSACGYLLLKRTKLGFNLSIINQIFQLLAVNLGFVYFSYSGLGTLMVVIQDGIVLKATVLNPSYLFYWGSDLGLGVGLDLIALFFLILLYSCREDMEQRK